MIVRHVLVGAFFTFVGLVSLMIPGIPFICIGALIFGPIELLIGLLGNGRPGRAPGATFAPTSQMGAGTQRCASCGKTVDAGAQVCPNCGAPLA